MTAILFAPGARDRREKLLTRLSFDNLSGFGQDDLFEAFRVFTQSCAAIEKKTPPLRNGVAISASLETIAHEALRQEILNCAQARRFFESHFRPFRISAQETAPSASGFLTGYYEPIVDGALSPSVGSPHRSSPARTI